MPRPSASGVRRAAGGLGSELRGAGRGHTVSFGLRGFSRAVRGETGGDASAVRTGWYLQHSVAMR
jgi:hypothetical protein